MWSLVLFAPFSGSNESNVDLSLSFFVRFFFFSSLPLRLDETSVDPSGNSRVFSKVLQEGVPVAASSCDPEMNPRI